MDDGLSFSMDTTKFMRWADTAEVKLRVAAQLNVKAAAKITTAVARDRAPVLKDKTAITLRQWNRATKISAGTPSRGGNWQPTVGAGSRPVAGLLKASIKASRRVTEVGGYYQMVVVPRGNRVHLYSKKMEAKYGYMRAGYQAAATAMPAIALVSYTKAWDE